ncbi:MAG: trypsin-like serine peptidase [Acidimicrobiales bacterium]
MAQRDGGGMKRARVVAAAVVLSAAWAVTLPVGAVAPTGPGGGAAEHWTPERMAAATPRDLVIDGRGVAYLRRADGSLEPHGHTTGQLYASPAPASRPTPTAKPGGGGGDTTGPSVTNRDPADGATIGASYTFKATVTDPSGVKSVSFVIVNSSGQTQSFAGSAAGDVWSVTLQGFTSGSWSWRVVAKDTVRKGNTTTTTTTPFSVNVGGGGGGDTVVNDPWTSGGTVQTAAGRIYFEMPANPSQTLWDGYVCSGTVAEDATTGRSVIITAAHCVYDDVHKVFAREVLFVPNQDGTSGSGTDLDCGNDPLGCWEPTFGVVDADWTTRTFPDNIPWDYAFYVVGDSGAHSGTSAGTDVLDTAAGDLAVQFTTPTVGGTTHALGYSYSDDPSFMYCAEAMGTEGTANWWLGQCELSGGSSGGPWMQPVGGGDGPIISVNSWGYTNQPGMAGPKLSGSSASCVFSAATTTSFASVTNRGTTAAGC